MTYNVFGGTLRLTQSIVTTRLDYCNAVFHDITGKNVLQLQRVQNSPAWVVCAASFRSPSAPLLRSLHWLSIRHKITHKVATLAFKALHHRQPTYLHQLLKIFLSSSSATVVRCWFTSEAGDIEQNLRPCIRCRSNNYMESASTESQNSYQHWTVSPCSKDSSVHSWLILWLTPATLTRHFHWWITAPFTNWMI